MNLSFKKVINERNAVVYSMPDLMGFEPSGQRISRPSRKSTEVIEREAFERGLKAGELAGFEIGKQKAEQLVIGLENILKEINLLQEKLIKELEPQVILLGITLARNILKEELSLRPEIIAEMIKEGLKKICRTGPVAIRVNPAMLDFLGEKKEELLAIHPDLRFEADKQVPEGGAIVSCHSEEVNTDLNFQLSNIIEELRTKIGHD
jgi:flagellar assembly protein FliH